MNFLRNNLQDPQKRPELLGMAMAFSTFGTLILWWQSGFLHPPCLFRKLTGWPCLTCNGTHSFSALIQGKLYEAFVWNPLIAVACGIGLLYTGYTFGVFFFKIPVFRISKRQDIPFRILFLVAAIVNWVYLILVC